MFWLLALRTIQRIKKKSCECGVVFSQVYFFFSGNINQVYSRPEVFPQKK